MSYVVSGLLPQVTAHLPPGAHPAGVVRIETGATLPVVFEPIVTADWRSTRQFYVVYADGEPACYYTAARWRRLVVGHRAWVLAGAHLDLTDRQRDRQREVAA